MSSFLESVNRSLKTWDYELVSPWTAALILPVISQMIHYVKLDQIVPPDHMGEWNEWGGKRDTVNYAHFLGGLVQTIMYVALAAVFSLPLLKILAIPGFIQMVYTSTLFSHGMKVEGRTVTRW